MTKLEAAAYLQCMAACAIAEIAAMQAYNSTADLKDSNRFHYSDFMEVANKYGIHHNSVLTFLGNAHG